MQTNHERNLFLVCRGTKVQNSTSLKEVVAVVLVKECLNEVRRSRISKKRWPRSFNACPRAFLAARKTCIELCARSRQPRAAEARASEASHVPLHAPHVLRRRVERLHSDVQQARRGRPAGFHRAWRDATFSRVHSMYMMRPFTSRSAHTSPSF